MMHSKDEKKIALIRNLNIDKNTALMNGSYFHEGKTYTIIDLPATKSILSNSFDAKLVRDTICFAGIDAVIILIEPSRLKEHLQFVLQVLEITKSVVLCIHDSGQIKNKRMVINRTRLATLLKIPVVETRVNEGEKMVELMDSAINIANAKHPQGGYSISYGLFLEKILSEIEPVMIKFIGDKHNSRWLSLKFLDYDQSLHQSLVQHLGFDPLKNIELIDRLAYSHGQLQEHNITITVLREMIMAAIETEAAEIYHKCVHHKTRYEQWREFWNHHLAK